MMLRIILVVFAVIAIADCYKPFTSYLEQLTHDEWLAFKFQHGKTYATELEEMLRLKTFMQNKEKIAKHNQKYEKRLVSFKLGLNKYADLTHNEFTNIMNGFNRSVERYQDENENFERRLFMSPANVDIKKSVDWRELGAVTEVKDQGHCGSCWAFSTTGALEGQHFRKKNFLVSLSEQNLVDCSGKFGNNGCDGGLMDNAFRYIKANGGIDTEKSYPYEGIVDACHFKKSAVGATDKGFVDIPEGDEEKLMEAVATVGPLSVAIDASHESFQFYNDGVYFEPKCDSQELDHGVLVVGYGTDKRTGADYWLVKNSWGTTWGDQGYIKMARNKANHCGIATTASYPVV